MPSVNEIIAYSPDMFGEITADLSQEDEIDTVRRITGEFCVAGLPVMVRRITPKSGETYYRVMCYVHRGTEAVLINTRNDLGKKGVFNGLNIQIRISENSVLGQLEKLPVNIREAITGAADCVCCTPKCEGKKYVFSFEGKDYVKCRYLCANFRFRVRCPEDVDGIVGLVRNEISSGMKRKHTT